MSDTHNAEYACDDDDRDVSEVRHAWSVIGEMRWQHVVLSVAALAAFVALCFSPAATCSLRISSSPTTTTTEVHP